MSTDILEKQGVETLEIRREVEIAAPIGIETIKGLPYEETMALWDRLDRKYFGDWDVQRSVMKQVMSYLRDHRAEILKPETD